MLAYKEILLAYRFSAEIHNGDIDFWLNQDKFELMLQLFYLLMYIQPHEWKIDQSPDVSFANWKEPPFISANLEEAKEVRDYGLTLEITDAVVSQFVNGNLIKVA